jgi:REP element-mobilizing transposase RayT
MFGMAGKYISVNLHLVWSTKERRALLDRRWLSRVYSYIGAVVRSKGGKLLKAGGQPDHIHLYISLPSTVTIADLVSAIKSNSSRWIRSTFEIGRRFGWQEGYGAFSVSKSLEKSVIEYIENQDKHHRRRDFRQEFLELLEKHEVSYDPRYIWD